VGLLDAGCLEVLQDQPGEGALLSVGARAVGGAVDQLVGGVDAEDPMGGEALDREGAGDGDLRVLRVGLVVEVLDVRLGRVALVLVENPGRVAEVEARLLRGLVLRLAGLGDRGDEPRAAALVGALLRRLAALVQLSVAARVDVAGVEDGGVGEPGVGQC
jgi:hypothetical protein